MYSCININSLRPSDAYLHQETKTSLVQVMAWRLFGAKPLIEPMMTYYQSDPWEQTLSIWPLETICFLKIAPAKWRPFCLGLNMHVATSGTWSTPRNQFLCSHIMPMVHNQRDVTSLTTPWSHVSMFRITHLYIQTQPLQCCESVSTKYFSCSCFFWSWYMNLVMVAFNLRQPITAHLSLSITAIVADHPSVTIGDFFFNWLRTSQSV